MKFITEELGEVEAPEVAELIDVLDSDSFGTFAVLLASDEDFVQAGNNWSPSAACTAFLETHQSDPWVLEYRDPTVRKLFRAEGDQTLEQIKRVFLAFQAGDTSWRANFKWQEVQV